MVPECKVFRLNLRFKHTRRGLQMCRWRDVIAGSSALISPIRILFSQNQRELASTGKNIIMVGIPGVLSQSLPTFRYRLSFVYQKFLNESEQNCNVYWSKVWIQLTPKLMCAMYSAAVPLNKHMAFCFVLFTKLLLSVANRPGSYVYLKSREIKVPWHHGVRHQNYVISSA